MQGKIDEKKERNTETVKSNLAVSARLLEERVASSWILRDSCSGDGCHGMGWEEMGSDGMGCRNVKQGLKLRLKH